MRIVELRKFIEFRKKADIRFTIYYSGILTLILFTLIFIGSLSDDNPVSAIFSGLLVSLFMFVLMFGIMYGMRLLINNGVERKRSFDKIEGNVLDVIFNGEHGILIITEEKIEYQSLTKMSYNKNIIEPINESLYIGVGKLQYGKMNQIKFGEIEKCHITINPMPNGIFRRYFFYNIEGSYDAVIAIFENVNKFKAKE